jgi:hypothetical protein
VSVLLGVLAGSALAADGVIQKVEVGQNYCHMKFQAIRPSTLSADKPELKTSLGDIIDFYGPCDETPTSKGQIATQRREAQLRFAREYLNSDLARSGDYHSDHSARGHSIADDHQLIGGLGIKLTFVLSGLSLPIASPVLAPFAVASRHA